MLDGASKKMPCHGFWSLLNPRLETLQLNFFLAHLMVIKSLPLREPNDL